MVHTAILACSALLIFTAGASGEDKEPNQPAAEMSLRAWQVPSQFISRADPSNKDGVRQALPGFQLKESFNTTQYDAVDFLKTMGITFPPGGEAIYDQQTSNLIVRNTAENLDLVDVFVGPCALGFGANVVAEISTYECRLPSDNKMASTPWPVYRDLMNLPEKDIQLLNRLSVVTKSGRRTEASHTNATASTKAGENPPSEEDADDITGKFQSGETGAKAEVECTVGPDGLTIDLNISYRFRKAGAKQGTAELRFTTLASTQEDYPVVLYVSPVENKPGSFYVVVGNVKIVNFGGWNIGNPATKKPEPVAGK